MNLKGKLIGLFILIGLIPFLLIGIYSYIKASTSLTHQEHNQLISIREIKKAHVEFLFNETIRDITQMGKSSDVIQLLDMLEAYEKTVDIKADGPYNTGSEAYKKILKSYAARRLKDKVKAYGYHDVFIIGKSDGHIMFTAAGEKDLGTNLNTGPYRNSHLAALWKTVAEKRRVAIEDFKPYAPSNNEPALFLGAPITRDDGELAGVIALQMDIRTINDIMHVRDGLGDTGEAYLIGQDNLFRSDSLLDPGKYNVIASFKNPKTIRVNNPAVADALKGNPGLMEVKDYRGREVISAYTHVDFGGIHWAILIDLDQEEAYRPLYQLRDALWVVGILAFIAILILGIFVARWLSRPILSSTQELNTTSAEILAAVQQQAASTKEQAVSIQQTTTTMEEINQTGSQITEKARDVAQSAEATSSASAAGIDAVEQANQTMEAIREQVELVAENIVVLSEKTQVIGEIISTVNDIAEQSNLLALNAAIEAVGAGEQGQRFSVVANEIKNLADRAKESTVQVRTILGEIQKGINASVMATEEAVKRVETGKSKSDVAAQTIRQLTESAQQSIQAFQQIVGGTNQQQIGLEQVTEALKNIRIGTEQTASGVNQIEKAVANLNTLSGQLNNIVQRNNK